MTQSGIIICGHGSRDTDAIGEFNRMVRDFAEKNTSLPVRSGFLEFATPLISDGLDQLRDLNCSSVLALPAMLFAAGHVKNDIPSLLQTYEAQHRDVSIKYARELGLSPKLVHAAGARLSDALSAAPGDVPLHDTLLLVAGRGASDPDANSNISKATRLLWEGLGFGWAETCYSGVTFPLTAPALDHAAKLGFKRIVIFCWFLFTGVLVKRIHAAVDAAAEKHPDIQFIKAGYFGNHPLMLDAFQEQLDALMGGANAMNCKLCKYRDHILGFEAHAGLPQQSHHHHVEGIGTGDAPPHDHDHHHAHHPPYPHAGHPLGPAGMKKKP